MEIDREKVVYQIGRCEWKDLRDDPNVFSDNKKVTVQFDFLVQESFELEVPETVLLDMKLGDCSQKVRDFIRNCEVFSDKGDTFQDFIESDEVPLVEATISNSLHLDGDFVEGF